MKQHKITNDTTEQNKQRTHETRKMENGTTREDAMRTTKFANANTPCCPGTEMRITMFWSCLPFSRTTAHSDDLTE